MWGEPLNAVSNIAFLVAAVAVWLAADSGFIVVFLLYYVVLFARVPWRRVRARRPVAAGPPW